MGGGEVTAGDLDRDLFYIVAVYDWSVSRNVGDEDAARIGGICVDCGREDCSFFAGGGSSGSTKLNRSGLDIGCHHFVYSSTGGEL